MPAHPGCDAEPIDLEVSMALLPSAEWRVAEALAGIGYVNPFLPERVELERRALGPRYIEVGPIIRSRPGDGLERIFANVPALMGRAEALAAEMGRRLEAGRPATRGELLVYEDLL